MREKSCHCGRDMVITLEEVLYGNKVRIKNVPIYHCPMCDHNEVMTSVKGNMKQLITKLGEKPREQVVFFNELSELAHLLDQADRQHDSGQNVDSIMQERINELLDMLILAESLCDEKWKEEINKRLAQIV